jgi:hypothetical protein
MAAGGRGPVRLAKAVYSGGRLDAARSWFKDLPVDGQGDDAPSGGIPGGVADLEPGPAKPEVGALGADQLAGLDSVSGPRLQIIDGGEGSRELGDGGVRDASGAHESASSQGLDRSVPRGVIDEAHAAAGDQSADSAGAFGAELGHHMATTAGAVQEPSGHLEGI